MSSVALDKFLKDVGLERPPSASKHPHIPAIGGWNDTDKKYWMDLYKKLSKSSMIDFGEICVYQDGQKIGYTFEDILNNAIIYETDAADRSSAGRFSSKLIAMEWAHIWMQIAKMNKMQQWCTALYYGAKKEFGDSNGPFLKIY